MGPLSLVVRQGSRAPPNPLLCPPVDDSTDGDHSGIEIDEQADLQPTRPQVCTQLREVQFFQPVNSLELHNDRVIHDKIKAV